MAFDAIGVYSTLAPGQRIPATTTGESTGVAAEVVVSVSIAVIAALSSHWLLRRLCYAMFRASLPSFRADSQSCRHVSDAEQPDGSTLLVSNRRDLTFNNTTPASDSMSVFSISPADGTLSFRQLFPAGGSYPRQFALNRAGNLVAVGLQQTGTVAILERDVASGVFQKEVARTAVPGGQVVCVVWDE